jgi:hypothetical protein
MRHVLAVLILGATLTLAVSTAFADQWINGFNVSTYSGCQAWHQSQYVHEGKN